MTEQTMKCPKCGGSGLRGDMHTRPYTGEQMPYACETCEGSGCVLIEDSQPMRTFAISLGDTLDRGGEDWGTVEAPSASDAVAAVVRDADHTRAYDAPVQLSHSAEFGRGFMTRDGNGTGAAARADWWYVSEGGRFAGIYTVSERARD